MISMIYVCNQQQWLTDMLKGELTELEMDMLLEDKILHELIDEQYQWLVSEFHFILKPYSISYQFCVQDDRTI